MAGRIPRNLRQQGLEDQARQIDPTRTRRASQPDAILFGRGLEPSGRLVEVNLKRGGGLSFDTDGSILVDKEPAADAASPSAAIEVTNRLNTELVNNLIGVTVPLNVDVVFYLIAGSGRTINLQPAAQQKDKELTIIKYSGAATLTIDPSGSETIGGAGTLVLAANPSSVRIISDGANWQVGGISP